MIPFSRPSEWLYLEAACHDVTHTWRRSCILSILEITYLIACHGVKLYLPLYCISELVRSRSVPALLKALVKLLPQVLRSSLFLGMNGGGPLFFICLFRHLFGRFYFYWSVLIPATLGTACAILVERPSRRPLLAGYVGTVAIELLYSVLKQRNLVPALPYGEVLLFSFATAVLFHRFRTNPGGGGLVNSVLSGLMSPKLPPLMTKYFQSTLLDNRLTHIILVGLWAFGIGYILQILPSLLNQRMKLCKDKGRLKAALARGFKFAAFLSSMVAGYKLINSILYHLPLPRDIRLLLAGLAAGLSMMLYRSTSLSLYVAWKAMEVLYSRGVDMGWLRYIPYGDVLIYALSTGWLLHGWFYESHNMRWTYWHFLRRATYNKLLRINYEELDKFGTGASKRFKTWENKNSEQPE